MYWTVKELAASLHIKPATLYAWAARGKIPCLRIHGLLRFDPEEIRRWVQSFQRTEFSRPAPKVGRKRQMDLKALIARAKRSAYTAGRGETRPTSSLIGKEDVDGAV